MKEDISNEEKKIAQKVSAVVCDYFNINIEKIYSKDRTNAISKIRGFVIYILHKDKKVPVSFLAYEYHRSIRTIFHICEQTNRFISIYSDYKKDYNSICKLLEND